jgi:hypothetical protein
VEQVAVELSGVPETLLGNLGRRAAVARAGVHRPRWLSKSSTHSITTSRARPERLRYSLPVLPVLQARFRALNLGSEAVLRGPQPRGARGPRRSASTPGALQSFGQCAGRLAGDAYCREGVRVTTPGLS